MSRIRRIIDMRGILNSGDLPQVEEGLVTVLEIEVAVQLDAGVIRQLRDVATERTVRETYDATERFRGGIGDELL